MHLSNLLLLSLGAATTSAFRNTSPFFLASTSDITPSLPSQIQLQTSTWLQETLYSKLSTCPSDYYILVSQPGVHSSDFTSSKSAPRLGTKLLKKDKNVKSSLIINEVADVLDAKQIRDSIEDACGAGSTVIDASTGSYPSSFGREPRVIVVEFPMLSLGQDRLQQLSDNDGFLTDIIDRLPSSKYTILYTTSPRESSVDSPHPADDSFQDPLHMDLKRDYSMHLREDSGNSSKSLFQEYQYLTPGIFMGLLASFVCIGILYVGFSALVSLKVPYAAFERDTSASVQKKQQ